MIKNATIVDGTGVPAFRGDLGVTGDRIATVSQGLNETAQTTIQADGLVLAPGFIDIHSHIDRLIFKNHLAQSKIFQGITSDVSGNCGIGSFPVDTRRKKILLDYLNMHSFFLPSDRVSWSDFSGYAKKLENTGIALNLVPLVPHGSLRVAVMGIEDRQASPDELKRMRELLHINLRQGAWGMSTGLIYPPGVFSTTAELVALAEILSRERTLYASHIREEDTDVFLGLEEAIQIGKETGVRVQVSHLKAMGKTNRGLSRKILDRLEKARKDGVDIFADQYPYDATSTTLAVLIPSWVQEAGKEEMLRRLSLNSLKPRITEEIDQTIRSRGGPKRVVISDLRTKKNQPLIGKDLGAIAEAWKIPVADAVIRLLSEEKAAVEAIYFSLDEKDVETIVADENVAVCTDGDGYDPDTDSSLSPHPRSYGSFPRVLGLYVREKGLLSLPAAIFKMTGLPASRLGFSDRGFLKPGFAADLVIFDPHTITDTSEFKNPHRYPTGILYVFVNGRSVIAEGRLTGERPGRVLRHSLR